eukprot:gene12906-biopygen4626
MLVRRLIRTKVRLRPRAANPVPPRPYPRRTNAARCRCAAVPAAAAVIGRHVYVLLNADVQARATIGPAGARPAAAAPPYLRRRGRSVCRRARCGQALYFTGRHVLLM